MNKVMLNNIAFFWIASWNWCNGSEFQVTRIIFFFIGLRALQRQALKKKNWKQVKTKFNQQLRIKLKQNLVNNCSALAANNTFL